MMREAADVSPPQYLQQSKHPAFDLVQFAETRLEEGKDLDDLHTELCQQLRQVRRELHSLIDERYEDFLGLSSSVAGIDTTIDDIKLPLSDLSGEISKVHTELASRLEQMDSRISSRQAVRDKKYMLRLFIDLSQLLDRVNAVLNEAKQQLELAADSVGALADYLKSLERAAGEFSQARYFIEKGGDYPFVVQAAERMRVLEERLFEALDVFLATRVDKYAKARQSGGGSGRFEADSAQMGLFAQCLRTYSMVGEYERAEALIRERLVRPVVTEAFGGQAGKGMGLDSAVLSSMFDRVLEFVRRVGVPLAHGIDAHLPACAATLEARVFWREISAALIAALPLLFVPGMPDRFHKNYLLACDFVRQFSALFSSQGVGEYRCTDMLASEESYVEFHRKWQLSAYFSIRKKQLTDAIDSVNSQQQASGSVVLDQPAVDAIMVELGLSTQLGARAMWAIRRCWAADVYLEPLASRFWQLTTQIVSWYHHSVSNALKLLIRSSDSSNSSPAANGSPTTTAAESTTVDQLLAHVHDIFALKQQCIGYIDSIQPLLPASPGSAALAASLRDAIALAFTPSEDMATGAIDHISATIVTASCANLASHLRRTTSQFRHTNRAAPKSPSAFVGKLFDELSTVELKIASQQQHTLKLLRDGACLGISRQVAKVSADALSTISKTEASLHRLRKTGSRSHQQQQQASHVDHSDDLPVPPGVDLRGSTPNSDNDKIRRQIWLDVVETGRIITESLHAATHEEYVSLVQLIEPLGT
ncbi:hypothetical protein IWW38_000046 [Coemansia aciculifera]|uniref:Uncharacterized protein n=1 Tax=Coemansia aciculifera TaxID=417176 RepID=A0ACC1MBR7_9FUNG|nr:hypothetical protein IWW38_000046 [Coemansia aciculifera]